jgi:hypothetical protein
MKKSGSQKSKSPSQLIDARIKELGDWRGKMLSWLRALVKKAVIGAKVGTVQPEAHRCLTMLGRYGISGWPGIANRAPR